MMCNELFFLTISVVSLRVLLQSLVSNVYYLSADLVSTLSYRSYSRLVLVYLTNIEQAQT